jgi:hypothetical protein
MGLFVEVFLTDMIEPLCIDERLEEQERARMGHVLARWLKKLVPVLAYDGPPRTRRSVEMQLRRRSHFFADAWSEYGATEEVLKILEILRQELRLPNHNFVPHDPVVVLMSSGYDKDDIYALLELEKKFSVKYSDEEIERIKNENWTLGRLVRDLLGRPKVPN